MQTESEAKRQGRLAIEEAYQNLELIKNKKNAGGE
jgi:hypothetical protein